jgi:thymidylate synthase
MEAYKNLVRHILDNGTWKDNRTGVRTLAISGYMLQHDLRKGFPLLTTKQMGIKNIATELEGFIRGITDKQWYQDRNCHIWDDWCNPKKVPYGNDEESKAKMKSENDLGPIYGYQWRRFNIDYSGSSPYSKESRNVLNDQFTSIVNKLKENPNDRRMICSAWNPLQIDQMALPPCHVLWNLVVINDVLNLIWYQRSCDTMLGIPYNLASYALLLKLLAKESGLVAGEVTGMLADVHIYENQINGAKEQLKREAKPLPEISYTDELMKKDYKFDIFKFDATKVSVKNYYPHPKISFELAV